MSKAPADNPLIDILSNINSKQDKGNLVQYNIQIAVGTGRN